jgi:4'-phosphopantetheinyl transferase
MPLERLEKDAEGAPLPADGTYWSLSHKPHYVAGVVAAAPIGIDLERIAPVSGALFRKTAGPDEWRLDGGDRLPCFFRFWTAKEAVLKAAGRGLKDLAGCRVTAVCDPRRLEVTYAGRCWRVDQLFFDGHLAAVAGHGGRLCWHLHAAESASGPIAHEEPFPSP